MRALAWVLAVGMAGAAVAAGAASGLSSADEAAAFTAAGFKKQGGKWRACEDPGTASNQQGMIDQVVDANGDGLPEAVISESSSFCYGMQGAGYAIVSKQPSGQWRLMSNGSGMPEFLATKGAGGWPDVSVGGPGFCFVVARWNGKQYAFHRHEYEGKPCKPER